MLLRELFPELAVRIRSDLRRLKRSDLSEQVDGLQILDRCRCGAEPCGTFYTQGFEIRTNMRVHSIDIMLECGATVTVLGAKIVAAETLDPFVTEALREP